MKELSVVMMKSVYNWFKCHRILTKYIITYIIILLISISIAGIAYFKVIKLFENEIKTSSIVMLKQLRETIDSWLKEINQFSMHITLNQDVGNFSNKSLPLSEKDAYESFLLNGSLSRYVSGKSFIDDFYIYYDTCDSVITYAARYPSEFFYKNVYNYTDISYGEWKKSLVSKYYYRTYIPSRTVISNNIMEKNMITFMQTVPFGDKVNHSATLVILIDGMKLTNMLKNISDQSTVFILNSNMEVIISDKKIEESLIPNYNELKENEGNIEIKLKDTNFVVYYAKSQQSDWKYIILTPKITFMRKANEIKKFFITICMINLFIGIAFALFWAFRNYKPIGILTNMVSAWASDEKNESTNEYALINEAIDKLIKKNIQLEHTEKQITEENIKFKENIRKNAPLIKNMLLTNLLKGNPEDLSVKIRSLEYSGINLSGEYYAVILIQLYSDSIENYILKEENSEEISILNFIQKTESQVTQYIAFELEYNIIAVIAQVSGKNIIDKFRSELLNMSNKVVKFISKNNKPNITVTIGRVYKEIEKIHLSYIDALQAFDYKIINGDFSVIDCNEIIEKGKEYYYPMEFELQLINNVKAGNMQDIDSLLTKLFDENLKSHKLPINLARCLFFDIMATVLKVLDEIEIKSNNVFNYDIIDELLNCRTIHEMRNVITNIFYKMCNYINENKDNKSEILTINTKEYIKNHFMDETICQTSIATAMKVSTCYLSRIFKDYTGQNMVDYINKLRVEKAKSLLENERLTLCDIAKMIGCSDISLIRIFKKHEGITPGKYREYIASRITDIKN